jgi:hypothetical protein
MASTRSKALGYLRGQNVRVVTATSRPDTIQPLYVVAIVRGHNGDYLVTLDAGQWTCTCDAARRDCAHRAAVQMVTGHKSAAAKVAA